MTADPTAPRRAQVPAGPSAASLAELLGSTLPSAEDVPEAAFALAEAVRDLVEAAVLTDVDGEIRADAAARVAEITRDLSRRRREQVVHLVRHADGRLEHLSQAGSGRLNPQAPRVDFEPHPGPPPEGEPARTVEITAHCTLTPSHGGPPGRVHGGLVAVVLDQVLGVAAAAAGQAGMTAGLDLRYRRATPYDVPLEITARWTGREGRKSFVTGEIRAEGKVTAEAKAVFVSDRPRPDAPAEQA